MFYIAHRANINGPRPEKENTLEAIEECFTLGLNVEVDVRQNGEFFKLGHDKPDGEYVPLEFFMDNRMWVHAKDTSTFMSLAKHKSIQTFFQADDPVALTSNGYFWCHSAFPFKAPRSILTVLEKHNPREVGECYAVCSDYPKVVKQTQEFTPRLILLDVDGVLTDGTKEYSRDGSVISKRFADRDFTAIKRFQAAGVKVVLLTSDEKVTQPLAIKRRIEIWIGSNKLGAPLADKTLSEIVFVGDDLYDLPLIDSLVHTYCPANAISDIKQRVKKVLATKGGDGVVAELYEELKELIPNVHPRR